MHKKNVAKMKSQDFLDFENWVTKAWGEDADWSMFEQSHRRMEFGLPRLERQAHGITLSKSWIEGRKHYGKHSKFEKSNRHCLFLSKFKTAIFELMCPTGCYRLSVRIINDAESALYLHCQQFLKSFCKFFI